MNGENRTESLDLDSIYKLHQEKYLNILVMCSANCIIELLRQAHLAETDRKKDEKQVVSRWLAIPTSGAVKDIATTRETIATTQLIIFEANNIHHFSCDSPPFVIRRVMNDTVIYSGVCIDLLNELARRLYFSFTIVEPEDGEWGNLVDGKWTGLVGQLVEKKADLVVAPIAVTKSREEVIDFTVPYFYVKTGIIIKTPSATTLFTLISPFHYKVHMCLAIALVLSMTFVLILEVLTSKCFLYRPVDKLRRYGDAGFNIFGSLVNQGSNYTPSMASSRILLSAWLLFTVILSATYSGNLIASITGGKQKLPFSTLAELAQQDTYTWGFDGGSNYLSLFRDSNLSDYQAIWQGMQTNREDTDVMSIDNDVHLRRVLQGRYAYIGDETFFELWKGMSCDLQMVEQQFDLLQFALGLPKNSTNTKVFSNE
ncbi:glutamate receptor ionotropic, kainate glr-3-like [Haliotis rubra]|uniref:glutamate receptor ionotropic, kainate glr-3-like n=1 Tax=Haliotis rubra TaxID=36100 RepID=UPI001EE5BDB0|nr:glutamate receptor ionotropic, kainate glr-3-like [Haliotis rubra]